jgi:hypothetical protein
MYDLYSLYMCYMCIVEDLDVKHHHRESLKTSIRIKINIKEERLKI